MSINTFLIYLYSFGDGDIGFTLELVYYRFMNEKNSTHPNLYQARDLVDELNEKEGGF